MLNKTELRNNMRKLRNSLLPEVRQVAAQNLSANLSSLLAGVKTLAIYFANNHEIDLCFFIDYCLANKIKVYAPIAYREHRQLKFERIYSTNPLKIFYPINYPIMEEINVSQLDLVLLPLLAADVNGNRLGQGGGYYDATFAERSDHRPILCGVGYDFQLREKIQVDPWDVKLNYFVSNKQIVKY